MECDGFNWDKGNREKCRKHGMSLAEIESVFARPVVILPDKENPSGEQRHRAVGTTSAGREAFVVFTLRDHGGIVRLARSARGTCTGKRWKVMKKTIPSFKTDQEAEDFVATSDLTEYDLSGGRIVRFELRPKNKTVNLRLPEALLDAVRHQAEKAGMPYQRYIRLALEQAIGGAKP